MQQKIIIIDDVQVPILYDDNKQIWYPIGYIYEKLLLKQSPNTKLLHKNYDEYISKQHVDYSFTSNMHNIQLTNCINQNGLVKIVQNMIVRKNTKKQLYRLNSLRQQIGLKLLPSQLFYHYNEIEVNDIISNYSEYTKECIRELIKIQPTIKWTVCKKCGRTLPYHENFFNREINNKELLSLKALCRKCQLDKHNKYEFEYYKHPNKIFYDLCNYYKNKSYDISSMYISHDILQIHYTYIHTNNYKFMALINTKEDIIFILRYYYNRNILNNSNICLEKIINILNISDNKLRKIISFEEICFNILGENYEYYPWHYPKINFKCKTFAQCKIVLDNYIREYDISIDDPLNFDYTNLIKKCKLTKSLSSSVLDFLVYYYNYQYAGYQFHYYSRNYYTIQENRIYDLKFFIEKDKKIPIDKIPLYLTKISLQRNARRLYSVLYARRYYHNLYEWVNECYPNKFIEADFIINPYRNQFDSLEESQIHDVLKCNFPNVIYNQRNTDNEINLNNMIPDWIILTNDCCILVEYFGLYVKGKDNKRINDYITRADEKIAMYNKMKNYKVLLIYPEDLYHDFTGLKHKILKFK